MTLRYRGHIGWNSSKIFSQLVNLGCSLSADPNITDLLQREHPEILTGTGAGYKKVAFGMMWTFSTFGDRAFSAASTGLWNSLPSHLKDADLSYNEFRRSLKTFLFGQWGHGAVSTLLTVQTANIRTYLLTYKGSNVSCTH